MFAPAVGCRFPVCVGLQVLVSSVGRCVPSLLPMLQGVRSRTALYQAFHQLLGTLDLSRPLPPLKSAQRSTLALALLLRAADGADLGVSIATTPSAQRALRELCSRAHITAEQVQSLPGTLSTWRCPLIPH